MADFVKHVVLLGQLSVDTLQPGTYFFAYANTDVIKRVVVKEPIELWRIKKYWTNNTDGSPEVFNTEAQANTWMADQLVAQDKKAFTITAHPAYAKKTLTLIGPTMAPVVKTVTEKVTGTVRAARSKWWFWPAILLALAGTGAGTYYGYKKFTAK